MRNAQNGESYQSHLSRNTQNTPLCLLKYWKVFFHKKMLKTRSNTMKRLLMQQMRLLKALIEMS
nr:hypothetical protein Iba_chr05bCG11920 [Ipomoea batatas]GMC98521.1 hypothetical protein Iba_chr05dCG17300 [Ipomoea batatas]GMD02252.1 hypothetical protein Iba_chr05fCG14840 [Ipomoea batatas]